MTIDAAFQKIRPVKLTAAQTKSLDDAIKKHGYAWGNADFKWFKEHLNKELRKKQKNKCAYCRRQLTYNKGHVHIDHIIDKGSKKGLHARFTFHLNNLILSCSDCNNNKGVKPVLKVTLPANSLYPVSANAFEWVHPYMHRYSEHLIIHKPWVYEARNKSKNGLAVIANCMLDKLQAKERANRLAAVTSTESFTQSIAKAVGFATEVGLDKLAAEIAPSLAKIYRGRTQTEIKKALVDAHDALQKVLA
jgi:uncharacterized protein (TIGR02646 family)